MSAARWVRLKKRIRKCKREVNTWGGFAFTLLGIGIPCAIQEIANYQARTHATPPESLDAIDLGVSQRLWPLYWQSPAFSGYAASPRHRGGFARLSSRRNGRD